MTMHVITGLPRSGSTLLCNILNQNPKFWATSTSVMPGVVRSMVNVWSTSVEIKGDLADNKEWAEERSREALKAFMTTWHKYQMGGGKARGKKKNTVIFDKSRGWLHSILALRHVYPDSKVLVTVRDLRNVFSSVEKQHRKDPLLSSTPGKPSGIYAIADAMFAPQGMIGSPLTGIQDAINRKLDVKWVKYERLSEYPKSVMADIYEYLEEEPFEHDFTDVKNTAIDPDAFYNFKFPHNGEGEVKPGDLEEWKKFIHPGLANTISKRYQWYNQFFNYSG